MKIRRILVTTDFSEAARAAYSPARALADKHDADLELVHVVESLIPAMGRYSTLTAPAFHDELRELLQAESELPVFEGRRPTLHLLDGAPPHAAIEEFVLSEGVDLAIVASHGHTGLDHVLLGSVAERLIQHLPVPVLTVRTDGESAPTPPTEVVVPYDFSPCSRAVLPYVRALADAFETRFTFVYVAEPSNVATVEPGSGFVSSVLVGAVEEAERWARESFEKLVAELPDVRVNTLVLRGNPLREITRLSKEHSAKLILLSTHGHAGLTHVLLGSLAEKIARHAPCSVLTVRPDEPAD